MLSASATSGCVSASASRPGQGDGGSGFRLAVGSEDHCCRCQPCASLHRRGRYEDVVTIGSGVLAAESDRAEVSTSCAAQPVDANQQASRRDVEAVDFSGIVDLRCGQVVGVFTVVVLDGHVAARQQLRQVCEIELVTLKPGLGRRTGRRYVSGLTTSRLRCAVCLRQQRTEARGDGYREVATPSASRGI
jgi:hypothetical protein